MQVQKNGTLYDVRKSGTVWVIKAMVGGVDVTYRIPDKDALSLEDVVQYINENDVF